MTEHYWRSVAVDALLELQALREASYNARDDAALAPPTDRPSGPDWTVNERDLAFMMGLHAHLGRPETEETRGWKRALTDGLWAGATAEEAFVFNLRFMTNHGDGRDIWHLSDEEIRIELEAAAHLPVLTKWSRGRIRALVDEAKSRRHAN